MFWLIKSKKYFKKQEKRFIFASQTDYEEIEERHLYYEQRLWND